MRRPWTITEIEKWASSRVKRAPVTCLVDFLRVPCHAGTCLSWTNPRLTHYSSHVDGLCEGAATSIAAWPPGKDGIFLGGGLRHSGQTQGCDGIAYPHIEITICRRHIHSVVWEKLPNKLLIIWLMWVCLWPPCSCVAIAAAVVTDALAIQSNCTLCVSHFDDGWPLRTIHP